MRNPPLTLPQPQARQESKAGNVGMVQKRRRHGMGKGSAAASPWLSESVSTDAEGFLGEGI